MSDYTLVHNNDFEKIGYVSFKSDGYTCDFPACFVNLDKKFIGLIPEYYFIWENHPITGEELLIYTKTEYCKESPKKNWVKRLLFIILKN